MCLVRGRGVIKSLLRCCGIFFLIVLRIKRKAAGGSGAGTSWFELRKRQLPSGLRVAVRGEDPGAALEIRTSRLYREFNL